MKPSQEKRVRAYLESAGAGEEQVLEVALAYPAGRVTRLFAGLKGEVIGAAAGGAAGAVVGKQMATDASRKRTDAALDRSGGADLPVGERNMMALTTGRLLLFTMGGAFTPLPKKLLWDIALSDVAQVPKPQLVAGVAKALRVDVALADGRVARLEFPRAAVAAGEVLVRELRARIGKDAAQGE
ncbi:hypothetical protein [Streptomyces sp. NPDC020917]|uniref:hypothetical protein n=1 Tax=Streptomyces sp. NPDC020917 TaxID=3365102 RepID=UPI00378D93AF